MRQPIEDVERPLALLIMFVFLGVFVFFGIRYFSKVREAAKREEVYRSTLRSYREVLKPGMKRSEVEEYLRSKNVEFFRSADHDSTKIGKDDSSLFCGAPDVLLELQFTASLQRDQQLAGRSEDTLNKIEIVRVGTDCI